jgi:hypothetical protein
LSAVHTFDPPGDDAEEVSAVLMQVARVVEAKLELHGLQAKCIGVKVVASDGEQRHRSHTLSRSIAGAGAIFAVAVRLLERTQTLPLRVQRLSLSASKLHLAEATDRQLELFPTEY